MQNSKLKLFPRHFLLGLIRVYQATLSPDHGLLRIFFPQGVCRFEQTCSEYTYQAVRRLGLKGMGFGLKRILSCHPFSKIESTSHSFDF